MIVGEFVKVEVKNIYANFVTLIVMGEYFIPLVSLSHIHARPTYVSASWT